MKNRLVRTDHRPDGIFGQFFFEGSDTPFIVTLEHAYRQDDGSYAPKLQAGIYQCVRGIHHLHSGPIETFEVLGVVGHSGILCCHIGNRNADSEGCVLAGKQIEKAGGTWWISNSADNYLAFMQRLTGYESFELEVS